MNIAYLARRAFFAYALASTLACGGATTGSDGAAGSLGQCGSRCSPAPVASSCSTFCEKFAAAACPSSTPDPACASHCAATTALTAPCASVVIALLSCTQSVQPVCTSIGTALSGCAAQTQP